MPSRDAHVTFAGGDGIGQMAIGRKVSYAFLHLVDSPLILFVSSLLSISAGLYELRAVSVYQLALVPGMVLMIRAVVVPSTAWRTLMLGLAAWPHHR